MRVRLSPKKSPSWPSDRPPSHPPTRPNSPRACPKARPRQRCRGRPRFGASRLVLKCRTGFLPPARACTGLARKPGTVSAAGGAPVSALRALSSSAGRAFSHPPELAPGLPESPAPSALPGCPPFRRFAPRPQTPDGLFPARPSLHRACPKARHRQRCRGRPRFGASRLVLKCRTGSSPPARPRHCFGRGRSHCPPGALSAPAGLRVPGLSGKPGPSSGGRVGESPSGV